MVLKVLELGHVAPPQGAVLPSTLRLTYFDLPWLLFHMTTERVFLFRAPRCSTSVFLQTHLADLKRSLSLALEIFYPLAGRLIRDLTNPHLRYSDGDSVELTVAESDDDLGELTSDGPREADRLSLLVPKLVETSGDQPVAAVQVTIFPELGISIGISTLHAVMDGSSSVHFLRTWASICKNGAVAGDLPILDRSVIPDPRGLYDAFLRKIEPFKARIPKLAVCSQPGVVHGTFRLTSAQVEKLRGTVVEPSRRCSSFTLAVAVVWTCLLRARERRPKETEWAGFVVDCRPRHDPPVPARYFGNCLNLCTVSAAGCDLVSGGGFEEAVAVVAEGIRGLGGGAAVMGMENMMERMMEAGLTELLSVAGSPRLRVYGIDFGWGRAAKVEVVSIGANGALSLAENGDEEGGGGLEIGLILSPPTMDNFISAYEEVLKKLLADE